jgi:hypothetical protein
MSRLPPILNISAKIVGQLVKLRAGWQPALRAGYQPAAVRQPASHPGAIA